MALVLKTGKTFTEKTKGVATTTAYLRTMVGFTSYSRDSKTIQFYTRIYYSKDVRQENPDQGEIFLTQTTVTGNEFETWFSHDAIANDRHFEDRAYSYLLDKAQKYQAESDEFAALDAEAAREYQFKYSQFAWLQGDIWQSDEVITP